MRNLLLFLLIIIVFSDCQRYKNEHDRFYHTKGGWDWVRVPLLKPYIVLKADPKIKGHSWTVDFRTMLGTCNVKYVDVRDSIIYILSGTVDDKMDTTLLYNRNVATAWYIIDLKKKTEVGFDSLASFNVYIQHCGYQKPQWYNIDTLSARMVAGKEVPWVPHDELKND